jgi:hypothetical protein
MALRYIKISNYINIFDMYLQGICLLIKPYNSDNISITWFHTITHDLKKFSNRIIMNYFNNIFSDI